MTRAAKYGLTGIFLMSLWGSTGNIVLAQPHQVASVTAACENYLNIKGESNVNRFSFRYRSKGKESRYEMLTDKPGQLEISIPIRDFEPSHPMMYGDFLVMMKARDYPAIKVALSRQELLNTSHRTTNTCPEIKITIAGITRSYKIECSLVECSEYLFLRGEQTIRLSDFQLKPPEKMLGLVKVNDEIHVNFGFIITFTGSNPISAEL